MDRFKQKFCLESLLVSGEPTFHHNNQVATSAIDNILYHIPGKSTIEIEFYKMCSEDNQIILELINEDELKIPKMQLTNLKEIIFKKLKLKKACDIFKLTVEHLRYCGDNTLQLILQLISATT